MDKLPGRTLMILILPTTYAYQIRASGSWKIRWVLLPLLLLLLIAAHRNLVIRRRPQLIVISIGGFRHDYMYLNMFPSQTAFLNSLVLSGVHASNMVAEFTTDTFPNHWTMATGLYRESHSVHDPLTVTLANQQEQSRWNATLPVWVTANRHGLSTAALCWPGSEVAFKGARHCSRNESDSLEHRVQTVLRWITEEAVDLTLLYLHEPDKSGQAYGPHSREVAAAIGNVDAALMSLVQELRWRGFEDQVNILIVADHGMTALNTDKIVNFNHTLDRFVHSVHNAGSLLSINAKPGMKQQLVEFLTHEVSAKNLPVRVFDKKTMPHRFHYFRRRRTPDVLIFPNEGYHVVPYPMKLKRGSYGFDNLYYDTRVPMIAAGPSFRKGVRILGFRQVDIYGLICGLLEIPPHPNNGTQRLLTLMLND